MRRWQPPRPSASPADASNSASGLAKSYIRQGQALFYFGHERSRFIQIFSRLGTVLMRGRCSFGCLADSRDFAAPPPSERCPNAQKIWMKRAAPWPK